MTTDTLVDTILEALRASETAESVNRVADQYREDVRRLYGHPEWRTRAIHIINLKNQRLKELEG